MPGSDADERADEAAADREPEVAERVLDAFERAAGKLAGGRLAGDRGAAHHEVDDLRDGEEPDQHRHQVEALPEVERAERVARHARLRVLPDRAEEEAERAGEEAAQHAARRSARRATR